MKFVRFQNLSDNYVETKQNGAYDTPGKPVFYVFVAFGKGWLFCTPLHPKKDFQGRHKSTPEAWHRPSWCALGSGINVCPYSKMRRRSCPVASKRLNVRFRVSVWRFDHLHTPGTPSY